VKRTRKVTKVGAVATERNRLMKLVERAADGDQKALASLRKICQPEPTLWDVWGDVADQSIQALIRVIAGNNLLVKEGISRKVGNLKETIVGPAPSPLERLLAERIAACWLSAYHADASYARNMKDVTAEQGDYYQRRQDRAHKRFLTAVKTLAQVRRLLFPAVQVNIGAQQVNKVEV